MLPDSKFYHLQVVKVGRRMHVFHCEATAKERERREQKCSQVHPVSFGGRGALLYNKSIRIILVEEMVLVGLLRGVVTAALGSSSTNSSVLPQAAMSATCLTRIPAGAACGVQQENFVAG